MNRFKNILIVVDPEDDNQTLFRRASALAKNNDAKLTIHGFKRGRAGRLRLPGMSSGQLNIKERSAGQQLMRQIDLLPQPLRQELENDRVSVRPEITTAEIIDAVAQGKYDLVMLMARSESDDANRDFGSTTLELMRKCPCPVWVMKPGKTNTYGRILCAVDPDQHDRKRDALNIKIMQLATSMAEIEDSELHIVHAWDHWGENALNASRHVSSDRVDRWVLRTKITREQQLDDLLIQFSLSSDDQKVHLLKGEANSLIPELARDKKIDLVVMGTFSRSGLNGYFRSNTAENVLREVDCSVLFLKPDEI